jgi:hypothetical protein
MNPTYKIPWISYIILICLALDASIITVHILDGLTPKFDWSFLFIDIILALSISSIVLISNLLYKRAKLNNGIIADVQFLINVSVVIYKIFCLIAYYSLFRLVMLFSLYSIKTSEPDWLVGSYVILTNEVSLHFVIVVAYFILSYFLITISKTSYIFQSSNSAVSTCANCTSQDLMVSPFMKTFKWFLIVLGGSILLPIILTILTNEMK